MRTPSFSLAVRALFAFALALGSCAPPTPPAAPLFDVDGPELRKRYQARVQAARQSGPEGQSQDPSSSEAILARGWVGDPDRSPVTSPEFDAIDREMWPEELFALELGCQQLEMLRLVLLDHLGAERFEREVLAPEARLAPPTLPLADAEEAALGVERRGWELEANPLDHAVDTNAWFRSLEPWRGEFEALRWVRCQPSAVRFVNGRAEVELRWAINGVLPGGGLRHASGAWRSLWVPPDDAGEPASARGWRLLQLHPIQGETLESEAPAFVEITGEALAGTGLDPRRAQPVGGFNRGVALEDVDGDGDVDIVASLPNRLLLNDGTGRFEDAGERLGIEPEDDYYGVLAADFDNDGRTDLVFSGKRKPTLYCGQREDGSFDCEPILVSAMNNVPSSLSAHDVDGDGRLDLFICGYGPFFSPGPNDPSNATNGRPNVMLRGLPEGGFEDVTEAWGLADESTRWAFIGSFGDADEDGDDDLYVAHDFGPNVLYRRLDGPEVRFRAEVEPRELSDPGFSMSSWWADLDGDLDLDMYVSNMSSIEARRLLKMPGNSLDTPAARELRRVMSKGNTMLLQEEREGERVLEEAASERGGRDGAWGWGTAVFDFDLDRDLDIACVNGFWSQGVDDGRDWDTVWWRHAVTQMQEDPTQWAATFSQFTLNRMHGWSWSGHQRSVFYVNDGTARFSELAPVLGLDQPGDGRALAAADLDNDGDLDLVGSNYANPEVYILRNDTRAPGHLAVVDLRPRGGASAAGTRVVLESDGVRQRRDVQLGGSYLAQHDLAQHFGLGESEAIQALEVRWPDGEEQRFENLPADRKLVLRQGEEDAEVLELRPRNELATFRVPPVEWAETPKTPFWVDGEASHVTELALEDAGGRPLSLTGAGTSLIVLWDPRDEEGASEVAGARELARAGARVLLLSVDPRVSSALPAPTEGEAAPTEGEAAPTEDGVAPAEPTAARMASDEGYSVLRRVLARWCGLHVYDLPVVLAVDSRGRVSAVQRGALWPDAWEPMLE